MKQAMEALYGKGGSYQGDDSSDQIMSSAKGAASATYEDKCYDLAEQIQSLAKDEGVSVDQILGKIGEHVKPGDSAEMGEDDAAMNSNPNEGKKSLVIAMLKKKKASV